MKLSLRAIALVYLLKSPKKIEYILEHTTDSREVIENTIRELQNKKMIIFEDDKYMRSVERSIFSDVSQDDMTEEYKQQEERIYALLSKSTQTSLIAWFLACEDILIPDDHILKDLARGLEPHTLMLQWAHATDLQHAYELLCQSEEKPVYAETGLLQTCISRLQRLYDFISIAKQ